MNVPIINEINLRKNFQSNKFIQLKVDKKDYFRFIKPTDVKYHFDILFNTLFDEFGIVPGFDKEGIPLKNGERYSLIGAGEYSLENNKINLYGRSIDYCVGPNKENADKISKLTGLEFIIKL